MNKQYLENAKKMVCQPLQILSSLSQSTQAPTPSVLQRRGRTLPELSVTPQDFSGPVDQDDGNRLFHEFLQYLYSPAAVTKTITPYYDGVASLSKPSTEPSLATPKIFSEAELEHFFVDIRSEVCLNVQTESFLNKTFSSHLSNNKVEKLTVLPRDQFGFTYQDKKLASVLLPNSLDSITQATPIVGKISGEKCYIDQFNRYFPEQMFTPNMKKYGQNDGAVSRFPENQDFGCSEDKENNTQSVILEKEQRKDAKQRRDECLQMKKDQWKLKGSQMKKRQNIIERKRRVEQHLRFRTLASHIPHISDKKKISRISILKAGIEYIEYLGNEGEMLLEVKRSEQEILLHLQMKLKYLT